MKLPVTYRSDVETIAPDEAETSIKLQDALSSILETTAKDYGHAVRAVHAKNHAVVTGELVVLPDLPVELSQGLFARSGRYPVVLRFSTNPGDILDDSITVPRGLALKVLDVDGPRIDSDGATTQDFIFVDGPAFLNRDAKSFVGGLTLLAKTTDRAQWAKKALSAVFRGTEKVIEAVGGESATLKSIGGARSLHPLGETYFSQVPFRYGDYIAKFSLAPVSASLTRFVDAEIAVAGRADAIREELNQALIAGPHEWELRVQLCRDLTSMPIEDASVVWDEEQSPFQTVARLRAESQVGWCPARGAAVDDHLRFSVWTGIEAHRPLGSVNRARRTTYALSAEFRARVNGCPLREPSTLDGLL